MELNDIALSIDLSDTADQIIPHGECLRDLAPILPALHSIRL